MPCFLFLQTISSLFRARFSPDSAAIVVSRSPSHAKPVTASRAPVSGEQHWHSGRVSSYLKLIMKTAPKKRKPVQSLLSVHSNFNSNAPPTTRHPLLYYTAGLVPDGRTAEETCFTPTYPSSLCTASRPTQRTTRVSSATHANFFCPKTAVRLGLHFQGACTSPCPCAVTTYTCQNNRLHPVNRSCPGTKFINGGIWRY